MKKILSWLLALAVLAPMLAGVGMAETTTYTQAPMLDELVAGGELPPLEERLPENPKVADDRSAEYLKNGEFEIGTYGGTLRSVSSIPGYNGDVFIMLLENICTMVDTYSGVVTPNLVEAYEVNDDFTEFTFHLRKGLRWSDGVEVTMEDFRFAIEDWVFNEELTPIVPAYFRDGGVASADPMTYEFVDDTTFRIMFKDPFGGFLVHMSVAGWKSYEEILKPSHYLKRFHPKYAEEIHGSMEAYYEFLQPYGDAMGYYDVTEEGAWVKILDKIDVKGSGETCSPTDILTSSVFASAGETENLPVLYPWVMESDANGVTTWVRNPYYHKVDAAGQQLPYIDRITSTLVEDMEMVQMKIVSGDVDYMREMATINNVTLYTESGDTANIDVYYYGLNNTPTDIGINMNYGLDLDGTVKDDAESQAWQEVATDKRFRQALMQAIDVEEIIDTVYKGFAEPDRYYAEYAFDPEAANALLDEMGMEIGEDGYRKTPSGKSFFWFIFNDNSVSDQVPVCELLAEYWRDGLKLNVQVSTVESTLLSTMVSANEAPMKVGIAPIDITWFNLWWLQEMWGPLWKNWWDSNGANGIEPNPEAARFFALLEKVMTVSPAEAVSDVLPEIHQLTADNLWVIIPLQNVQQSVVANRGLRNIPLGGIGIASNFVGELFFYAE